MKRKIIKKTNKTFSIHGYKFIFFRNIMKMKIVQKEKEFFKTEYSNAKYFEYCRSKGKA